VAARAVETGARPAALALSAPECGVPIPPGPLRALGLGGLRAPGSGRWRRDRPDSFNARWTHDPWRGQVTRAWQLVNPDLRMGGPSLDWIAAFADLRRETAAGLPALTTPVLVLEADGPVGCVEAAGAQRQSIAGAHRSLELEDDARRSAWLSALEALLDRVAREARAGGRDHAS